MPDITKPVILDETGQTLKNKIEQNGQIMNEIIPTITNSISRVIEAIDRLDIIYYVEK